MLKAAKSSLIVASFVIFEGPVPGRLIFLTHISLIVIVFCCPIQAPFEFISWGAILLGSSPHISQSISILLVLIDLIINIQEGQSSL